MLIYIIRGFYLYSVLSGGSHFFVAQKNQSKRLVFNVLHISGELGIRTPGPVTVNSFQDCRNRPLCQLSGCKIIVWQAIYQKKNGFIRNLCKNNVAAGLKANTCKALGR
jgi:hypothetical protein